MRTGFLAHRPHRPAKAIVFTFVLAAAFFAFAPAAEACDSQIAITKIETGSAAPGGTYTITMTGDDLVETVEVTAGQTVTIEKVPPGTYVLAEVGGSAEVTIVPNPVIVTKDDDGRTIDVVVTNPFPAGKLAIEKVAAGDTAPDGTYTFDVTGPDDVAFSVDIAAGDTWTSDWLPLGTYTITERNAPDGHTITPNPVTLDTDGTTVTVTATNPYRDFHGKLAIEKVATGDTAPDGTYAFDVTGPDDVAFSVDIAAGDTWTSDWLPLGTYTITERNAPDGHTITPNPVTLDTDGTTVTVTATNPYRDFHGKLAITKVATGELPGTGSYRIDVAGPEVFTITLGAGETWTSGWLPLGSYTITEPDGPNGHTIAPNPVVLAQDQVTVTVTVTNPVVRSGVSTATLPATGLGTSGTFSTLTLATAMLLIGAVAITSAHAIRRPQRA